MALFRSVNLPESEPFKLADDFTIRTSAKTDLWDKPPSTRVFNCPMYYQTATVASFRTARVTVSAEWKDKYDQGGLCIIIRKPDGSRRWVKSGVEFVDQAPHVSTVATDRWSDWSLRPMPLGEGVGVTIEMAKHDDGSLWVYLIEGTQRSPLREVTWFNDLDDRDECWVGVYVAKPSEIGQLLVHFSHLMVEMV